MAPRGLNPREYRSWSFTDRTFITAAAVSLLWHFFWFFSIKIIVSPPKKAERPRPELVSLGAVIDDAMFKTLVESKPELSQSFYRRPSDLSAAAELPTETTGRQQTGDVVSVPLGRRFLQSLKDLVSGSKSTPNLDLSEEERRKRLRLSGVLEESR